MGDTPYIKIYGSRGTVPVCEDEFKRYGGNTSCVGYILPEAVLVFDAGTGIRRLAEEWKDQKKEYHIFISHMHMDHIQSLPLFAPFYDKEASITIYGMEKNGCTVREQLHSYMHTQLWPVGDDVFRCRLSYRELSGTQTVTTAAGRTLTVTAEALNHPGGSAAFCVQDGKNKFVYALDYEHGTASDYTLETLAQDADILIYDGQYFPEEYEIKKGFGHSTWEMAAKLQKTCAVRQMIISHHEPLHKDIQMETEENNMRRRYPDGICFAREGVTVSFEKD